MSNYPNCTVQYHIVLMGGRGISLNICPFITNTVTGLVRNACDSNNYNLQLSITMEGTGDIFYTITAGNYMVGNLLHA